VADINVERKGPSIWPWIVGLIVLALLIWALTQVLGRDQTPRTVTPVDTPAARVDTPIVAPGVPGAVGPGVTADTPMVAPGTPGTPAPGTTPPGTTQP
jgi:hypothetical protein